MKIKLLETLCKHVDGIAGVVAIIFMVLLSNSNTNLQRVIDVQSEQIKALTLELKASNEVSSQRLYQLMKVDENIDILKSTVIAQNEAITMLTEDVRKLSSPPPELQRRGK